jgi:hypothetical protein
MDEIEEGPLAQLVPDVLGVVLGFIDGIEPLVRLSSCSHQFSCSVKEVVNLKAIAATREGFILKQGETWPEALRFIELRDGHIRSKMVPQKVPDAMLGLRVIQVAAGSTHTAAVTSDGELWTSGRGFYGQIGHGTEFRERMPRRVMGVIAEERCVAVVSGRSHVVALTESGAVFTFGFGGFGQLGHGKEQLAQYTPRRVEALAGHRIVSIAAGTDHTIVLTDKGVVLTFGANLSEQLGRDTAKYYDAMPGEVDLSVKRAVSITVDGKRTDVVMANGAVFTFPVSEEEKESPLGSMATLPVSEKDDQFSMTVKLATLIEEEDSDSEIEEDDLIEEMSETPTSKAKLMALISELED